MNIVEIYFKRGLMSISNLENYMIIQKTIGNKTSELELVKLIKKQCHKNAKENGHTEKEADKCDEINNPICKTCPFICK